MFCLTRKYLEFSVSYSPEQVITRSVRATDQTETPTDRTVTKLRGKSNPSDLNLT